MALDIFRRGVAKIEEAVWAEFGGAGVVFGVEGNSCCRHGNEGVSWQDLAAGECNRLNETNGLSTSRIGAENSRGQ